MDINTGKLASTSSSFIKKIKENDTNNKTSKIDSKKEEVIAKKIREDFSDIKTNNEVLRSKLVNTNNRLTHYENELSKAQYVEQKLDAIAQYIKDNIPEEINKIITNSNYKNENVLKEYFTDSKNIEEQLKIARETINTKYNEIDKGFKEIEVTSQNIISLYSRSFKVSDDMVKNIDLTELAKSTNISNKRVIDLIS